MRVSAVSLLLLAIAVTACRLVGEAPGAEASPGFTAASVGPTTDLEPTSQPGATAVATPVPTDLHLDAAEYAEAFQVPIEEASRRLYIQGSMEELATDLRAAVGDRWAGEWLEHTPEFRYVVRLLGDAPSHQFEVLTTEWPLPVDFIAGTKHSVDELGAASDRLELLVGDRYGCMSHGTDIPANAIYFWTPEVPPPAFMKELRSELGVPVYHEPGGCFTLL